MLLFLIREALRLIGWLGHSESVEACDLTVRSERAGEPLEVGVEDCATR